MRVSKKLILVLCLMISLVTTSVAYAASGGAGDSLGKVYGSKGDIGWGQNTSRMAGIRITFVDKNGKALSEAPYSYSYYKTGYSSDDYTAVVNVTNVNDKSKINMNSYYNKEVKDGKFYLKYKKQKISDTYPKLSILASNFNSAPTATSASKTRMTKFNNVRLANASESDNNQAGAFFAAANNWFENLTKGDRKYNDAKNDALALAHAISKTSQYKNKINYKGIKKLIESNCDENNQIFIIMEPIANLAYQTGSGWTGGVFGTPIEIYDYVFVHSGESYWAINRYSAYLTYQQDEKIPAYKASKPIANGEDSKYESLSKSINYSDKGWGMNLDWLKPDDSCVQKCKVTKDGKFYFNGDLIKEPPAGFSSIYEYAFSKSKKNGAKCCSTVNYDDLNKNWKNAYKEYCEASNGKCSFDAEGNFYNEKGKVTKAPRGFSSIAEYAFSSKEKNNKDGADCCDLIDYDDLKDRSFKTQYKLICEKPDDNCCTEAPIVPGEIFGEAHNCCYENTHSEMQEYKLNELFCKDPDLNITYYMKKCNIETYTKAINDYCELVCTERVSVDVPSAITATSGRYFELTKSKYDFKSTYIEGYKRCRTIIKFDDWLSKYESSMNSQVSAYNSYQKNEAYRKAYQEAYDNRQEGVKDGSSLASITCRKDGETTISAGSCHYEYTKYPTNKQIPYYGVQLSKNGYNSYSIAYDGGASGTSSFEHPGWAAQITSRSDCERALSNAQSRYPEYSCSLSSAEVESRIEDIPGKLSGFASGAQTAQDNYKSAANTAEIYEKQIDKCDHYFDLESELGTKYEGSNAQEMYKFKPSQAFEYSQKYLDGNGKLQTDVQTINFKETPGCKVDDEVTLNVPGDNEKDLMIEPQYSSKYNNGKIALLDFRNTGLELSTSQNGYQRFLHDLYNADKKFTSDARYHVTCGWEEEDKKTYSLVPGGDVVEASSGVFTYHNRQYNVLITTLSGKYETNWLISNIGERSQFDKFLENGNTCSGNPADAKARFTCGLEIKNKVYKTGQCNPDDESSNIYAIKDDDDCDVYNTGKPTNFEFKIVDPTDIFPGGTKSKDGKDYAYNWTGTQKGVNTREAIENAGKSSKTYAPESLSYSFVLDSTAMKHIKNYNKNQNSKGGYADFESYKCECPPTDTAQVCTTTSESDQTCSNTPCKRCKSSFIDNLYNGKIIYGGATYKVNVWKGPNDLSTVRSNNNW